MGITQYVSDDTVLYYFFVALQASSAVLYASVFVDDQDGLRTHQTNTTRGEETETKRETRRDDANGL